MPNKFLIPRILRRSTSLHGSKIYWINQLSATYIESAPVRSITRKDPEIAKSPTSCNVLVAFRVSEVMDEVSNA
jgi:hypothetical protein